MLHQRLISARRPALLVTVCLLTSNVLAADPATADGIECAVDGRTVRLAWSIHFFAPIDHWVVSRSGTVIAKLAPEATSFVDEDVPQGEHVYSLAAVQPDGSSGAVGQCSVVVGSFGMRCALVDRGVALEWGPILIDVLIRRFLIRRDGALIAVVPPDQLEHVDVGPPAGSHRYTVHAETSPGHAFIVGACSIRVPAAGFECSVEGGEVTVDWSEVTLPRCGGARCAFDFFRVTRDGEVIALLDGDARRFVDEPGPGAHDYVVSAGFGGPGTLPPEYLVGECRVVVPGGNIPPPSELTCLDLDVPSGISIAEYLTRHDVLLVWQKPVDYDAVVIARNGHVVATLPGEQFHYVDRGLPPGVYTYAVSGVLDGAISEPAKCLVRVPRDPLPPPTGLTCEYVGLDDPDGADGDPLGRVVMRWVNGASYEWIVVVKNGEALLRLPGAATSWVDTDPGVGVQRYEVFGVVGVFRSDAAACRVTVPPGAVPPVEDLRCSVICPVPETPVDPDVAAGDDDEVVGGAEDEVWPGCAGFLRWSNPVGYDRILIYRNRMQIAVLPGDATSHLDRLPLSGGRFTYRVIAVIGARFSEAATCTIEVEPPVIPPPMDLECVVSPLSLEPDEISAEGDGVVANAEELALIPVVRLTWVNPIRYAGLVLERDGEVIARLPGTAMRYRDVAPGPGVHRYSLRGHLEIDEMSEPVECEVDVPPEPVAPVVDLACAVVQTDVGGASAYLRWENGDAYDAILIQRDGEDLIKLPGDSTSHLDPGLEAGVYRYAVIGLIGNLMSRPEECRVAIPGPPPVSVLYFSSGLSVADDTTGDLLPVSWNDPGKVRAMASLADPVQGWSFGVCSDPSLLEVEDATIEGTTTATLRDGEGPSFLALSRHDSGVTMAVVVDEADPSDTLPPGSGYDVLALSYGRGSDAVPGGTYRVSYCDRLGDPPVAVLLVVKGFEVVPRTLAGWVRLPSEPGLHILRGDANGDRNVDMSDALKILNWLFLGAEEPPCLEQADSNASRQVNVADPIYVLQFLFAGGPEPPAPYPDCGAVPRLYLGCEKPTCPQPIAP